MDKYYLVVGPASFINDPPGSWWIMNSEWASKLIVTVAAVQDTKQPGLLYKIIYRPPNAPQEPRNVRLPIEWVEEIPCFKYIEPTMEEQWTLEKTIDGKTMVVRK